MAERVVTVFGGSGFVGRHLVRRLAADEWVVRVAVRDPESAAYLKPMGDVGQIVPVAADVTRPDTVAACVVGAEAVVNLVGILYEKGKRTFQRIHVEGAETVAKAAAAAGATRFVQMSALGADPEHEAQYARTKAAGEVAVLDAFPNAGVVRPSVVFGPEDNFFNQFALIAKFSPVLPVFPTRFQPVWVGDVADAMMRLIADPGTDGKTYELGGPRVLSFREIMEIVMRETERRRLLAPVPFAVARIEATVLELLPVPPLTRDQVKLLSRDNVVTAGASTLADLGISPTAIEAVVPSYLRRYRDPARQKRRAP